MSNKAVSKAVIQVALVIGLVLAANAIKPFSLGNLVLHTLSSARSLSFVLPSETARKIENAGYLARTFGKSLLNDATEQPCRPGKVTVNADFLAANYSPESEEADIRDVTPNAPGRKQTPAKRSTRRVRQDIRSNQEQASAREADSGGTERRVESLSSVSAIDSIAMAQPLPIFKPTPTKAYLTPATAGFSLSALPAKLNSCKTIEVKEVKLIALIQQSQASSKLKVGLVADQPAKISLQCRDEEKAVTEDIAPAAEAAVTTGPEEELFFEPFTTAPLVALPAPECRRVP
ncbi:MAG TPA: hypothetical protein PLD20_20030 [Blastocatellia bacterium]|nr:hypothetical protein [Blastocatellia bacterium]HMV83489.1 hypothetical protein [Blastocatellia bacterium]HMX29586.1 hypothetical protein [Blastocatellia bacterium]HMY72731.1 hypothetical protein [Blastocatellia bacterium]HMZ20237.1 hypothetical protein [Blastocatellia bacterium]